MIEEFIGIKEKSPRVICAKRRITILSSHIHEPSKLKHAQNNNKNI